MTADFFVVHLVPRFDTREAERVPVTADFVSVNPDGSLELYDKYPKWFPVFKAAEAHFAPGIWSHYVIEELPLEVEVEDVEEFEEDKPYDPVEDQSIDGCETSKVLGR